MDEGDASHRKKPVQHSLYNMDNLISAYSSMDEELQGVEEQQHQMIIPNFRSFCVDTSLYDTFPLPIGLVVQPFVKDPLHTSRLHCQALRCDSCGAVFDQSDCLSEEELLKCAFCGTVSNYSCRDHPLFTNNLEQESYHEESSPRIYEYVEKEEGTSVLYSPSSSTTALLFIIDKSLSGEQFQHIQESLEIVLNDLPIENCYTGLIVYGEVIEIYEFGGPLGEADVFSGSHLPDAAVVSSSCFERRTSSIFATTSLLEAISTKIPTRSF